MIFWLASYPKSGNTWIRLLLANWFSDEPIGINETWKAGMDLQDVSAGLWGDVAKKDAGTQLALRETILGNIHKFRHGTTFVKTHSARGEYRGAEMVPAALTAGAIYLVRDPRDVAISFAKHMDVSIDRAIRVMNTRHATAVSPDGVIQYMADWSSHVSSWAGCGIVVRYEDLIQDPIAEFGGILEAMGETINEEKLEKVVAACDFDNCRAQEIGQVFNEGHGRTFFNKGESTWRHVLSEKQEKRLRRRHGKVMKAMRYT